MRHALLLIVALLVFAAARADTPDLDRATHLLHDADQRFKAAMEERAAGSSSAADGFRAAARSYEAVAQMGISNPSLHTDAGNAYLLGGDIGRAVLSFQRADLLRPHDPAVRAGLADARAQVQVSVPQSRRARFTDVILAWRPHVPRSVVFTTAIALYLGAWLVAITRSVTRGSIPGWIGVSCAIAAGCLGASILIDHRVNDGRAAGVVIAEGITARNGPSAAVYLPTFTTPLRPGVELQILEHRDGWYHVRLADSRQTWLPDHAVEVIAPPAPLP
jgi:hypothetical protein